MIARFDYWRAAAQTTKATPVFGTGPGTFQIAYQKVKRPESEPSRLAHNDYLEQASDSGLPGFILYAVFIVGGLAKTRNPKSEIRRKPEARSPKLSPSLQASATPLVRDSGQDWPAFWVWLGVLGWALQGLVEFGLYIPALAWPAFALMGWLLGRK